MKNILLVEDDALIADTLVFALEQEAFTVQWKSKGTDAINHFDEQGADLILLDIGLPDMNGFDVLRAIRERSQVPVIFTTARDEEIDKVLGLELGADDYVTKPLSPRELVARVKANLKRVTPTQIAQSTSNESVQKSVFSIDLRLMEITLHDSVLALTVAEFKLLQYFIDSPRQVFSREQLISAVWDNSYVVDSRTIDTHIKSLRAKLRDVGVEIEGNGNADYIKTHRGLGYSLDI